MLNLDRLTELESLGLVVRAVHNSFKSWSFEAKQELSAIKNKLALCHICVAPKRLTFVVYRVGFCAVDIIDILSKVFE